MALAIDENKCSSCGLCADICPYGAISPIGVYKIDPEKCTACGECIESCPSYAIMETG